MNGQQLTFCKVYALEANGRTAYLAAYPKCSRGSASQNAYRLLKKPYIHAEVMRIRTEAERMAGSAVLKLMEKRKWIARLVRADIFGKVDGDLLAAVEERGERGGSNGWVRKVRLPDKIAAIKLDNNLAGEETEAEANDALGALLERVMK